MIPIVWVLFPPDVPLVSSQDPVETVEDTSAAVWAEAPKGVADGTPDTLRTIGDKTEDWQHACPAEV